MYISSDTNIWIDFQSISHLDHPFRLKYEYYISRATFEDELIKSEALREELLERGLHLADISDEELILALTYQARHTRLSIYDSFALSIAKSRNWVLLSGDKPLRDAAKQEGVECHGTIWIYDQLLRHGLLSAEEMDAAMDSLIQAVETGACRLPMDELKKRKR